jgi:hypothetical protein
MKPEKPDFQQSLDAACYSTTNALNAARTKSKPRVSTRGILSELDRPTEAEVHRALHGILVNRDARAVNWAVAYARAGLDLEGEDLRVQCLYILNNITHWRGDTAAWVRRTLKAFAGVR